MKPEIDYSNWISYDKWDAMAVKPTCADCTQPLTLREANEQTGKCHLCTLKAKTGKRGRQVFSTDEIPHLWAHKVQSSARNNGGNLYFNGPTIYSYRDSFPIASHVTGKTGAAVLITNDRYSVTTGGHISSVRRAIPPSVKVFTVANVDVRTRGRYVNLGKPNEKYIADKTPTPDNAANVKDYLARIDDQVRKAAKAIKNGAYYKAQAAETLQELREYCEFFGVKKVSFPTIPGDLAELRKQLKAADREAAKVRREREAAEKIANAKRELERAKVWMAGHTEIAAGWDGTLPEAERLVTAFNEAEELARKAKRDAENLAELKVWMDEHPEVEDWDGSYAQGRELRAEFLNAARVAQWLAGESVSAPYGVPAMLRVKGDEVETSQGARFPLSHAKRGLALVRSVKARGETWRSNGHTCHLGHYKLDRIDPDGTVHAGCHVVGWPAIERIAAEVDAVDTPTLV